MYILFNNQLSETSFSATDTNASYPVSNLLSPFLRKRWQSNSNTDTITINILDTRLIKALYFGYTNAHTITVNISGLIGIGYNGYALGFGTTMYGFGGGLATALPVTNNASHFSQYVSKITITLETDEDFVYLGGIGIGVDYELQPPSSFWQEAFDDRSIVSESQAGQVLQEYVEPLRIMNFYFNGLGRDKAREFQREFLANGVGKAIWVDPNTDDLPTLYARFNATMTTDKNKRIYNTKIVLKEAR